MPDVKPASEIVIDDRMIDNLFEETRFGKAKKEAENYVKTLSKEEWHRARVLAKRNLFFLNTGVLGHNRLSPKLHGNICAWIQRNRHEQFRGLLIPRGHFKSTIFTVADSIRIVLPYTDEDKLYDDNPEPLPWPEELGTNCRLLIAHETSEGASRFLFQITQHFTANPVLMGLFPECVPSYRKQRVNKHELELPRDKFWAEPTIDSLGVGARSQGRHYNHIKLDDIYGDKARDSEVESQATKDWFDNIQSFFSTFAIDRLDMIGTRYSFDDVYAHAMEVYEGQMKWYIRGVEETNPKTGETEAIFSEEFTPQRLAVLKKNKKVFSAQYNNDPETNEGGFKKENKREFFWLDSKRIAVFSGTEAHSRLPTKTTINVRDLDICIFIDPGVSKSGGFVVTGVDFASRVFLLVALPLAMEPPELVELIFKQVIKWQPRIVVIESDLFASVYQHWLNAEMSKRGIRFKIEPVHTQKKEKDDRIAGLTHYYDAHLIYHNATQLDYLREYEQWRKSKKIHILDALAYGPQFWRPGYAPGQREMIEQGTGTLPEGMDLETGYSAINE
jgi:hypothetical protein